MTNLKIKDHLFPLITSFQAQMVLINQSMIKKLKKYVIRMTHILWKAIKFKIIKYKT